MTALTMPARPEQDASLRPVPWRRMAWVTWRQHRFALAGVAALLGALAVCLWLVGLQVHHAYAAAAACHPAGSAICYDMFSSFSGMDGFLANGFILQAVPALIGAFVGAPVLAREMETGTFRYAWTQGFGRWRWTLAKLVLLAMAVAAAAGLFTLLMSWYFQPYFAARLHAVDQLPAGQPVLAIPVDRGRLAADAVSTPHRRDHLARPPPRRLIARRAKIPEEISAESVGSGQRRSQMG